MTTLSYEVFPPNSQVGIDHLSRVLAELRDLDPAFISVTCSSKTSQLAKETVKVADYVQNQCQVPAMAHLPAWYLSKADVDRILEQLRACHVNRVLVLRGDERPNLQKKDDFTHASDLIAYIRQNYPDFQITGACYPEKHPESLNMVDEIQHLRLKVAAGCDQIITQLFLDNQCFYRFRELCAVAGIEVPIIAGVMPIVNERQANRILRTSAVAVPEKFKSILAKYQDHPQALKQAGITYAIDQIVDLVTKDVAGVHLYTMNQADTARQIKQNIGSLFQVQCEGAK